MREEKKKKRKRILSVVLAVTMGMSVLTGCGGGVSENSQSAGTVELKGESIRHRLLYRLRSTAIR